MTPEGGKKADHLYKKRVEQKKGQSLNVGVQGGSYTREGKRD